MTDIYAKEKRRLDYTTGLIDREADGIKVDALALEERIFRERKYMREELPTLILTKEDASVLAQQNAVISHAEIGLSDAEKRLDILLRMKNSPYFGRFDFTVHGENETKIYVGLSNLFDENYNPVVCDWRAPVCSLFYEQGMGETFYLSPEGKTDVVVSLLRQFKITKGVLEFLIDPDLKIDDAVLMSALSHNASPHMKTIAATIQREQNSVIRDGANDLLIVLGPAGSGKTNIALHRVAYLLYRDRDKLRNNNILIFSPNKIFSEYISGVVPELGERDIPSVTFKDLIAQYCGVRVRDFSLQFEFLCTHDESRAAKSRRYWISVLNSSEFLSFFYSFISGYTPDFRDIVFNGTLIYSALELLEMFNVRFSHLSIMLRLETIKNEITMKLAPHKKAYREEIAKTISHIYTDEDQLSIKTRLAFDEAASGTLEDISHNVSVDWPLLCRRVLLLYAREHVSDNALREELSEDIPTFSTDSTLNYEDGILLLLLKVFFGDVASPRRIRYVVIDEIQDYSPCAHVVFGKLFSHCRLTLLGDIAQTLNPLAGISSAQDIRGFYPQAVAGIKYLTKSYRNTYEIFSFAANILKEKLDNSAFERHGAGVLSVVRPTARELAREMSPLLARCDKNSFTAVITKTFAESRQVYKLLKAMVPDITLVDSDDSFFENGVFVIPLALAKGLEFDRVFISDSSLYQSENDRMPLYTACSRAMHELTVCSVGFPSPLIPTADK